MGSPALVAERNSHPYLTYEMIKDIPKGFRATLRATSDFTIDPADTMLFTGNGTALYSAVMGSQVLALTSKEWRAEGGFEIANYPRRRDNGKPRVTVGVSHSGITKSTMEALQREKSTGAKTIGVTHFAGRPISKIADRTIVIGDAPDKSRCHTKAYTNSAAAVFALSLALAQPLTDELARVKKDFEAGLPDEIEAAISSTEASVKKAAGELRDISKLLFAGAGPNHVTAREVALKIKEASYLSGEGMELEEILHGPAMSFNEKTLVVAICPSGPSVERARDLIAATNRIGASTMIISDVQGFNADYEIRVNRIHEYLSPFLAIIPLYLFSYWFAVENGKNPDYIHYTDQTYWDARTIIFPPGTH